MAVLELRIVLGIDAVEFYGTAISCVVACYAIVVLSYGTCPEDVRVAELVGESVCTVIDCPSEFLYG